MIVINSVTVLSNIVVTAHHVNKKKTTTILMGGYSRTGKSTLACKLKQKLENNSISTQIITLDWWLVSFNKRKPNSKVIDRYDTENIIKSLNALSDGQSIYPPHYDPVSRMRVTEKEPNWISFRSGVLIVEGVIGLAVKELIDIADLKIFVEIADYVRLKRLIHFYKTVKKTGRAEYKKIILQREKEEVPYIKKTSENADIIFNC